MGTFNFDTKNDFIDGKIEYDISDRTASDYKVTYSVYLRRNNGWTGTPTHGSLNCYIYSNGTHVRTHSHPSNDPFYVKNGGSWCKVGGDSYRVSLDAWSSATHTIGVKMSGASGITGLHADYQTKSYTVGAYRKGTEPSGSSVQNNGNNTLTISISLGEGGQNNPATECHIYGTTNGTSPSTTNYSFAYGTGNTTNLTKTFTLVSSGGNNGSQLQRTGKSTRVWVKPYTIGKYGGNNYSADTSWDDVYFYEPPEWTAAPVLSHPYSTKPTHKAIYRVDWSNKVKAKNTTAIYKYAVYLYINNATGTLLSDNVKTPYYEFNGKDYNLKKDDQIKVKIVAYDKYGNGTDLISGKTSNTITIKSSGVMLTKISDTKWVEGQVYIKTAAGWKESIGVYVKTSNGWKESI